MSLKLTTRDTGVQVEQWTYKREYRVHEVLGLPVGTEAVVIEDAGKYKAAFKGHPYYATDVLGHDTMAAALDEIRKYVGDVKA